MAGIDKNSSLEDKVIALNVMVLADKVDKTDAANFSWAKTLNKPEDMEQYFEKYLYTPESTTQTPDGEVKEDKPKKKRRKKYDKKPPTPEEHKASNTYKALIRTNHYKVLREEVLMDHNYTCLCCGSKYPTRTQFKKDTKDVYPLFVKSKIPLVKYLEVHKLFDVKNLMGEKNIFDHQNYFVLCNDCAPLPFLKKKDDTINE